MSPRPPREARPAPLENQPGTEGAAGPPVAAPRGRGMCSSARPMTGFLL
ncbi:hypothetical protein [Actinoplanes sp. HUAS TT8]